MAVTFGIEIRDYTSICHAVLTPISYLFLTYLFLPTVLVVVILSIYQFYAAISSSRLGENNAIINFAYTSFPFPYSSLNHHQRPGNLDSSQSIASIASHFHDIEQDTVYSLLQLLLLHLGKLKRNIDRDIYTHMHAHIYLSN